jgi:hypothetical protein
MGWGLGQEVVMLVQSALAGLIGLKSLIKEITSRLFRKGALLVFAETYTDMTILIEPASSYKLCRFERCDFRWAREVDPTKIFFACTFGDCAFGRPLREFLAYSDASIIDQEPQQQVTRRLALEEAVRRTRRRHPYLTVQCLDPCCYEERRFIAQLVSAEYSNIVAEAA